MLSWRSYTIRGGIRLFRHLSLFWARSIQSMPSHPTSWTSILILSSHLQPGLQSGLLPSGFPTKILYISLLSPRCAAYPSKIILLDLITRIIILVFQIIWTHLTFTFWTPDWLQRECYTQGTTPFPAYSSESLITTCQNIRCRNSNF